MSTQPQAYLKAITPLSPWYHLSDEDVAAQLDQLEKRGKAARKASETRRKRQREKQGRVNND